MTTSERLFGGSGATRMANTRIAGYLGKSESTIRRWRKDPDQIPWGDMKQLIALNSISEHDLMRMAREKVREKK